MTVNRFPRPISWSSLAFDLRSALRKEWKAPAFATAVILVLAVGFGIGTAMFSAVRTVLLAPLPFRDPGRLAQIVSAYPKLGARNDWSAPLSDVPQYRAAVPAFQDVGAYHYALMNFRAGGLAEPLYGLRISANVLPMLGVRPQLGKWFSAEDDRPGSGHVLLLSDDLWRRQFGADRRVVGKTIELDENSFLVVGVMPRGFNFPLRLGTTALLPTDQMQFWIPLASDFAKEPQGVPSGGIVARLRAGVSFAQAQQQLVAACRTLEREFPATHDGLSADLVPLRRQTVENISAPLMAMFAATGFILLLTCANIAGLLLARGESRAGELAVRMALGGSPWRVASLPLLQGVILCGCGWLLSLPVAAACIRLLIGLAPLDVPRLAGSRIDLQAILFSAALALVCGLVVGGVNALQILRRSPREVLADASQRSAGKARTTLRSALVAGQVALAIVLVSGAGLMLRTFLNLLSTDTGYQARGVLYGVTVLPPSYSQARKDLFFKKVLDILRNSSGVQFAGVSTGFPYVGQYDGVQVEKPGMANGNQGSGITADFNAVSPGYLETMGVRLIEGRLIAPTDTAGSPKVVVIDTSLARLLWPGQDPLGKLINVDEPAKPVWRSVVGVLAPMRNKSLDLVGRGGVFAPLTQAGGYENFVVLKSTLAPGDASQLLRHAVAAVDANQGVFFAQSMEELVSDNIAVRRFVFIVLAFFGAAALLLSVLGIYGLVSFLAASRVREVGIRMALGATRGRIAALVVSFGLRLAALGCVAGVLASLLLGRLLSGLLFGVRSVDAATLLLTVAVLASAATLAALIPAWRSVCLQPMKALRND